MFTKCNTTLVLKFILEHNIQKGKLVQTKDLSSQDPISSRIQKQMLREQKK